MEKKTTVSRGENWGIKAAHGAKWLIHKLRAFDKRCVAKAKSKNRPAWLGHIPLVSMILTIIALLTYFSLYILFTLGSTIIFFAIIANRNTDIFDNISNAEISNDTDENSYDGYGYRAGNEGYGFYAGGERIDNDND
ncbi:DUF3742 family protein [Providencia rettgeri]|uniref:DUF3742 family protein n=1 Tax=Providencia rettgeri TaxID=587 RepID=UPI0024AB0FE8